MTPRVVVLLVATVVGTTAAVSAVSAFRVPDSFPEVCSECRLYDNCAKKFVTQKVGQTYKDGCGNLNTFLPDCTVDVVDAPKPGPSCPSTCPGKQPRHVRDVYKCIGREFEMLPGCNERDSDSFYDSTPVSCSKCRMYDACAKKDVIRGPWEVYEDKCSNSNLFKPNCSVGVNELKSGPGCPSECDGKMRQPGDRYNCKGDFLEMRPGCTEDIVVTD